MIKFLKFLIKPQLLVPLAFILTILTAMIVKFGTFPGVWGYISVSFMVSVLGLFLVGNYKYFKKLNNK